MFLPDLTVGEAVKREVGVLGDGVGMVDTVDPLGHEDGLLLEGQGFSVVSHDVVESCEHSKALRDFRMHCAVPGEKMPRRVQLLKS
jgi:hypothetical protein